MSTETATAAHDEEHGDAEDHWQDEGHWTDLQFVYLAIGLAKELNQHYRSNE